MSVKNWDPKHWFILALFVAGFAWAVWGIVAALPSGSSASAVIAALLPVALLSVSHWMAFFKDPPSDPVQALQEGEQAAAAGKAGSRGFGRTGILAAITLCGIVGIAAQAMTGCAFFKHEAPVLKQDAVVDVPCVIAAILSGGGNFAACGVTAASQLPAILDDAIAFYEAQNSDAGTAGAMPVPFKGIPARLTSAQIAQLKAYRAMLASDAH